MARRASIRLSENGKRLAEIRLASLGINKGAVYKAAGVAEACAKRFFCRQPIKTDSFLSLIDVLDLSFDEAADL